MKSFDTKPFWIAFVASVCMIFSLSANADDPTEEALEEFQESFEISNYNQLVRAYSDASLGYMMTQEMVQTLHECQLDGIYGIYSIEELYMIASNIGRQIKESEAQKRDFVEQGKEVLRLCVQENSDQIFSTMIYTQTPNN